MQKKKIELIIPSKGQIEEMEKERERYAFIFSVQRKKGKKKGETKMFGKMNDICVTLCLLAEEIPQVRKLIINCAEMLGAAKKYSEEVGFEEDSVPKIEKFIIGENIK